MRCQILSCLDSSFRQVIFETISSGKTKAFRTQVRNVVMTPNANVNWMYSVHINKSTTQFDSSLASDDKLGADLAQWTLDIQTYRACDDHLRMDQ